jgi:hypothetical protein
MDTAIFYMSLLKKRDKFGMLQKSDRSFNWM